ncbi:MAG: hypothetical protein BZ137_05820 [Methanosphaera sp. rholeuAM130]|nr:MAG: hypothetical protein BZ137_05820 [Methanosphaera sp. rholeuAM130]
MDNYIITYLAMIAIFLIMTLILRVLYQKLKNTDIHILKPEEYLPKQEIQTLKQVFYLVMMTLFVINIFYQVVAQGNDVLYFAVLDIILSLITLANIRIHDLKSILIALAIIPYSSMDYMIFDDSFIILSVILFTIHLIALFYFTMYFYKKFKQFTKSQGLSYTILLLFGIVFFSFIFTSIVESVNLLDSLVMVSNAFTSNGYAILGSTIPGKLNSIFLVWSGYILSSVGTATLSVGLMIKYYNNRFDKMEKMIQELKEDK